MSILCSSRIQIQSEHFIILYINSFFFLLDLDKSFNQLSDGDHHTNTTYTYTNQQDYPVKKFSTETDLTLVQAFIHLYWKHES